MSPVPELDDLITTVGDRRPSGTALDRLAAASDVSREVGRLGEDLIAHFVAEARAAGAAWSDIGGVLGVSRQGAHQRHHDRGRPERWWKVDTGRWASPTREALTAAVREASAAGSDSIGTDHLLLGVLDGPGNLGLVALERCGVDPAALRAEVQRRLQPYADLAADPDDATPPADSGTPASARTGPDADTDVDARAAADEPDRTARAHPDGPDRGGEWGRQWGEGGRGRRRGGRGPGGRGGHRRRMRFTPEARRVIDLATGEVVALKHRSFGCEHLLLGLAGGNGDARDALASLGATIDNLRAAVVEVTAEPHPRP
jgi:Clp amino terminal domain, pathogenicity island component